MPQFDLESVQRRRPAPIPTDAAQPVVLNGGLQIVVQETDDVRVWLDGLRTEFDSYYEIGKRWAALEPDVVLTDISAITARLTEIRAHLLREGGQRANKLRLNEVDPLLSKLEEQYKIHSRLISLREFDWKVAGGAAT